MWRKVRSQQSRRDDQPLEDAKEPMLNGLRLAARRRPLDCDREGQQHLPAQGQGRRVPAHQGRHGRRRLLAHATSAGRPTPRSSSPCEPSKGDDRKVHLVESSPRDQLQPKLITLDYLKPGDKLAVAQAAPVRRRRRSKEIPISDELFPNPWSITPRPLGRRRQGVHVRLQPARPPGAAPDRGRRRHRQGAGRSSTRESKTFIDYAHKQFLHAVPDDGRD